MQRSTSGGGGPSARSKRDAKGQVVSLDTWKLKKKQRQRRDARHRRLATVSILRGFAWTVLVLEILAALASCIPSAYETHSVIITWALGIIASATGLWLNVKMDLISSLILRFSGLGMLLSLAAGIVITRVAA